MHDVHIRTWDTERATTDTPTSTHMHNSKHTHSQHRHTYTHRYTHVPTLQTQARGRLGLIAMTEGKMDLDGPRMWVSGWLSRSWQEPPMFTEKGRVGERSVLVHSLLSRSLEVEGHVYSVGLRFTTGCPYSLCRVPSNRCKYNATFQDTASQNNPKQRPAHFHLPITFPCVRSVRINSNKPGYQA